MLTAKSVFGALKDILQFLSPLVLHFEEFFGFIGKRGFPVISCHPLAMGIMNCVKRSCYRRQQINNFCFVAQCIFTFFENSIFIFLFTLQFYFVNTYAWRDDYVSFFLFTMFILS